MQQPNIVFIFMDDMGWRDLGCSGSTFYETPNIEQMCREGTVSYTHLIAEAGLNDPDTTVAKFNEELKAAGIQKIPEEA